MRRRELDNAIASTGGFVRPQSAADAQAASLREAIEQDERDMARLYARWIRNRAEFAHTMGNKRPRHAVAELAGTAKIGQDRSSTQLEIAVRLQGNFPQVLELLENGRLFRGTVDMLATLTRHASAAAQVELGHRLGDRLVGMDAVDARELIVQTLLEVEADLGKQEQKERMQRARAKRGFWIKPVGDGMTRIGCEVDDVTAQRWALDIEQLVRAQTVADRDTGVQRTMQQRRADVFAELPGRQVELIRAMQAGAVRVDEAALTQQTAALMAVPLRDRTVLDVHLAVSTSLGLDSCPARIEGAGPIESGQVQALLPIAAVRRVFVDATSGVPIALDAHLQPPLAEADGTVHPDRLIALFRGTLHSTVPEPQHDPSAGLSRLVHVRDLGCTGPGCPTPARQCQQDHILEFGRPGGVTSAANLEDVSLGCHLNKHEGWHVERLPNGTTVWHSPLGGVYKRRPRWLPPPLFRRERLRHKDATPGPEPEPTPKPKPKPKPEPTPGPELDTRSHRGPDTSAAPAGDSGCDQGALGDSRGDQADLGDSAWDGVPHGNSGWDEGPPPF